MLCLLRASSCLCLTSFQILKCRLHFHTSCLRISSHLLSISKRKPAFEVCCILFWLWFPPFHPPLHAVWAYTPHQPTHFLVFLFSIILVPGSLYFLPLNTSWKFKSYPEECWELLYINKPSSFKSQSLQKESRQVWENGQLYYWILGVLDVCYSEIQRHHLQTALQLALFVLIVYVHLKPLICTNGFPLIICLGNWSITW